MPKPAPYNADLHTKFKQDKQKNSVEDRIKSAMEQGALPRFATSKQVLLKDPAQYGSVKASRAGKRFLQQHDAEFDEDACGPESEEKAGKCLLRWKLNIIE